MMRLQPFVADHLKVQTDNALSIFVPRSGYPTITTLSPYAFLIFLNSIAVFILLHLTVKGCDCEEILLPPLSVIRSRELTVCCKNHHNINLSLIDRLIFQSNVQIHCFDEM